MELLKDKPLFCALSLTVIITSLSLTSLTNADKDQNTLYTPILGHTVIGAGPEKVIALHNFWEDQREYEPMFPYLNKKAITYAFVDVRGYHKSRDIKGNYTVKEVADDVIGLADYLGWDKFHIVGHSMTGMVAQRVALDAKSRVKSVVALTPVPSRGLQAGEETYNYFKSLVASRMQLEIHFENLLSMYTGEYAKFHSDRFWNNSSPEVNIAYVKMWNSEDFSSETKGLTTPFRVVFGSRDQEFNLAVKSFWEEWYPNCEILECKDATHFVTEEAPLCVVTALESFVLEHDK